MNRFPVNNHPMPRMTERRGTPIAARVRVVSTAVLLVLAAGCVGDSGAIPTAPGTSDDPVPASAASIAAGDATETSPRLGEDGQEIADALAAAFLQSPVLQFTSVEADCVGTGYVRVYGEKAFADVDPADSADLSEALSAAEETRSRAAEMAAVHTDCGVVIRAAAARALTESTEDLTDGRQLDLVNCVAGELDENEAADMMEQFMSATDGVNDSRRAQAGQTLAQLGRDCGFRMRVYP